MLYGMDNAAPCIMLGHPWSRGFSRVTFMQILSGFNRDWCDTHQMLSVQKHV